MVLQAKLKFINFIKTSKESRYIFLNTGASQLCFDLTTSTPIQFYLEQQIEPIFISQIAFSAIFCIFSQQLISSDIFLSSVGFIFGVIFAVTVIIYYMQRTIRTNIYSSIFFGYLLTVAPLFLIGILRSYIKTEYNIVFLSYMLASGFLGACCAYVYGPITNERLKRVLSLILTVFGFALHFASQSKYLTICSFIFTLSILALKFIDSVFFFFKIHLLL